jgi:hypothetical protein
MKKASPCVVPICVARWVLAPAARHRVVDVQEPEGRVHILPENNPLTYCALG